MGLVLTLPSYFCTIWVQILSSFKAEAETFEKESHSFLGLRGSSHFMKDVSLTETRRHEVGFLLVHTNATELFKQISDY